MDSLQHQAAPAPEPPRRSLGQTALHGSAFMAAQVVINKVVASVATLLLGDMLTANDFGIAGVAVSIGATCILFQTWVFVDVSIADRGQSHRLLKSTQVGALLFGVMQALLILAVAALAQYALPDKRGLALLIAIIAFRPLSDALSVAPLAQLRISLSFREQAWIDGVTAGLGSAGSVLLAYFGFGPVAIVLPPIATLATRAVAYWAIAKPPMGSPIDWRQVRNVSVRFVTAAAAAYLTSVTYLVDSLLLSFTISERSMGFYAFSFNLAIQATVVIAQNVASSMQPVFAAMGQDVQRQADGLLRTVRLVSIVTVPASLIQATFSIPVFHTFWGNKWDAALPIFIVLSIGQSLFFVGAPSIYLLKAQGRFRAYLKLEAIHLAYSVSVTLAFIWWGGSVVSAVSAAIGLVLDPDAVVPLAVAIATAVGWAIFGSLTMWLACRGSSVSRLEMVDVMLRPWTVSAPIAVGGGWISSIVLEHVSGRPQQIALVVFMVAVTFGLGVFAASRLYESTRNDLRSLCSRFLPWMHCDTSPDN